MPSTRHKTTWIEFEVPRDRVADGTGRFTLYRAPSIQAPTMEEAQRLAASISRRCRTAPFAVAILPDGQQILRGDGHIDVGEIARAFGGNGDRNAATIPSDVERLQALADKLCDPERHYAFTVERREDGFWWTPDGARHYGDAGDYLGPNYRMAARRVEFLLS